MAKAINKAVNATNFGDVEQELKRFDRHISEVLQRNSNKRQDLCATLDTVLAILDDDEDVVGPTDTIVTRISSEAIFCDLVRVVVESNELTIEGVVSNFDEIIEPLVGSDEMVEVARQKKQSLLSSNPSFERAQISSVVTQLSSYRSGIDDRFLLLVRQRISTHIENHLRHM